MGWRDKLQIDSAREMVKSVFLTAANLDFGECDVLERYPGFETHEAALARAVTFEHFRGTYFDVDTTKPFFVKANWVQGSKFRLTRVHCASAIKVGYEPETVFRQYFSLDTPDGICFEAGNAIDHLVTTAGSVIVPPRTSFNVDALGKHDTLALRIEADGVNAMIDALFGDGRAHVISFEVRSERDNFLAGHMRQAILQLLSDLRLMGATSSSAALDSLGQALILKFIYFNRNNLSEKLLLPAAAPSVKQGKLIEAFVESKWNGILDIEEMTKELHISARSIFRYFKTVRGMSPMSFQKDARLQRSRAMLQRGGLESVGLIAKECGFKSLGHFSREYREKFGELPSETLRHIRSIVGK